MVDSAELLPPPKLAYCIFGTILSRYKATRTTTHQTNNRHEADPEFMQDCVLRVKVKVREETSP